LEYELKVLEHIIAEVLNPTKIKTENLKDEFLKKWKLNAEKERDRIRDQFTLTAFGRHQQSDLQMYYRKHQAILVQLADMVYNYLQPDSTESIYGLTNEVSILDFYKEISRIPEDLVGFIQTSFPEYFDYGLKVPEVKRWLPAPKIKRNLKVIQKELAKLQVDVGLIKLACFPIEDYFKPEVVISYHGLDYLQTLQQELISFTKKKDKANVNEELCRLLLHLNFNSIRFFNYYILQLEEKAKEYNTIPNLHKFYSLKLKIINQLMVKTGLAYKPGIPSIREQIGSWICEEIYYLEKQCRILQHMDMGKTDSLSNGPKIHTSLSVPHLALAVKLLVESKVITNTNAAELMRLVARNFRTDKQETISEDSLRNKSYSFESSTINRLKDEIIGLMNLVRKY